MSMKAKTMFTKLALKANRVYCSVLYAFRYQPKPRLPQPKHLGAYRQCKEFDCNCSSGGHVSWKITGDMWKIAALSAATAFVLYINTIYADFAYDDR